MSTNEDGGADDSGTTETSGDSGADAGPGTREVAYRLFATEFEDSELSYSESDEERAPNYVVTPTGLRLNRLFTVGVLTEVERLNSDTLRGRIVDPTGAFVTYAGQYQPEARRSSTARTRPRLSLSRAKPERSNPMTPIGSSPPSARRASARLPPTPGIDGRCRWPRRP
jgi:Uncharacterized protein conserved in archaea